MEVCDAHAIPRKHRREKVLIRFSAWECLYYTTEPYRLLKLMLRATKETVLIDTFTAKLRCYPRKRCSPGL